jgi:hypothetical protein
MLRPPSPLSVLLKELAVSKTPHVYPGFRLPQLTERMISPSPGFGIKVSNYGGV